MLSEFIEKYLKNLMDAGYMRTDNPDARYIELQQQTGPVMHLCVLVDTSGLGAGELSELMAELSRNLTLRCERTQLKNVFTVYILIGGSPHEDAEKILAGGQPFMGQRAYEVFWTVEVADGCFKLTHNPEQPDEVGGMAKALSAVFKTEPEHEKLLPRHRHIYMDYFFMALNGAIFALMGLLLPASDSLRMVRAGAIVPELVLDYGQYYRLLAAMFLHFDLAHLGANLLGLYIFGSIVEQFLGGAKYMLVYLVTGLVAGAVCLLNDGGISAGASGAVYGMIGVVLIITIRAPKGAGFNFYNVMMMVVVGVGMSFVVPNISYEAHIGGLVAGLLLGLLLARPKKKSRLT